MNPVNRFVPWMNWDQWMYVKMLLYSVEPQLVREGVDIVDSWKIRPCGVPVAVESTALFSELIMKMDECLQEEEANGYSGSYNELCLAASLALIRMVNGMIDVEQKGVYSKSVNTIAEEIGLPRIFVDLRHRCTHNDIPSFDVLYNALKNAKHWLYDAYWLKQEESLVQQRDALIQQLVLLSRIASTNTDMTTYHKKGEVNQILRNLFVSTSTTDIINTMIPVLSGTSRDVPQLAPLVLPDPKDADRDVWLDNWLHIISIAYSRWNGFLDCIMENMALYLSLCEDLVSIDLLLMLIRKLYSRSFYGMVLDKGKKGKGDEVCSEEELRSLGLDIHRYLPYYLQARSPVVLQFVEEILIGFMTEREKELVAIRKEMISDVFTSTETRGDVSFEEMDQFMQTRLNHDSCFTLGNSCRNSSNLIPIGTLLVCVVCNKHKASSQYPKSGQYGHPT